MGKDHDMEWLSKVEEAGKTVGEFVPKKQIKGKTNVKLKCDDVIMKWMIRWGAMMVSGCMVGKDGRTSYERRRGRACRAPAATFGEQVWYKQIREQKERKDKIESEWHEGLWLGQSRSTRSCVDGLDG